jgi:hypothetical protein
VAAVLAGCGDNSKECGAGTTNVDGVCMGAGGGSGDVVCGDGTMLQDGMCVIDPSACQDGTVLIAGDCVDPTEDLTADVTEGAEPNGLSVGGEDSMEPAGQFDIKAIGATTVIQGNLNPHPDSTDDGRPEPDVDTYLFEASGPMLLEISVDGVGGALGGFEMFYADSDPNMGGWVRKGVATVGDTAKRQVYIPVAGVYALAIEDTRTITDGSSAGDPLNKYFVSIEQKAIPTATSVSLTNGSGTASGVVTDGEVDFFTAAAGIGIGDVQLESFDDAFTGALVVQSGPQISQSDELKDPTTADSPADALFASDAGQTLIIVDHEINTVDASTDYRLSVHSIAATQIATDGASHAATVTNPVMSVSTGQFNITDYKYFYFDTTSANTIFDVNFSFNVPVTGTLLDSNFNFLAQLTFPLLTGSATRTFQNYTGSLLVPTAGRYFFFVQAPNKNVGTDITLTSTFTAKTPTALTFNTPLAAQPAGTANSTVLTYDTTTEPWQVATLGANGASGGARASFFDATTAKGFLNTLTTSTSALQPTGIELQFNASANATVSGNFITTTLPHNMLVVVSTTSGNGTWDLGTVARVYTNEGTKAVGSTANHTGETLPKAAITNLRTDAKRYFLKTAPGNVVTITAIPSNSQDIQLRTLDSDEAELDFSDTGGAGTAETLDVVVDASGFVAYEVDVGSTSLNLVTGTYDLNVTIAGPTQTVNFYTVGAGTATWTNICDATGAKDITPVGDRDENVTAAIDMPAGLQFYGTVVPKAVVSTNGWLSFDTTTDASTAFGAPSDPVPSFDAPAQLVAPYWADLTNARICTLTNGNKITIQWRGTEYYYGTQDAFQAILDASDQSIQFVYAPYHQGTVTDGDGALSGTQVDDTEGQTIQFFDEADLAGTSVKMTHP